ncbi:hypothetical protein YC2023_019576 [Brassica napus]
MSPRPTSFPFRELDSGTAVGASTGFWLSDSESLPVSAAKAGLQPKQDRASRVRTKAGPGFPCPQPKQDLPNPLRRKRSPEEGTVPEKIPHRNDVLRERSRRVDEGTIIWQPPEQWKATLFDGCSVYTNKEKELLPRVEVRNELLNH